MAIPKYLKSYFRQWLQTHQLRPWKYTNYIIVITIASFIINACLSGMPIAPLFGLVGGMLFAYLYLFLRLHILGIDIYRTKHNYWLLLVNSLLNGLIQGYMYLLYFYIAMLSKPSEIDWLNFGIYEFFQQSQLTKFNLFFIFALIGTISYAIGGLIIYNNKIAKKPLQYTPFK